MATPCTNSLGGESGGAKAWVWGAQALLEVRRRFLVGSGRPSMLMLVRSAAALATMRPVLLLRVLKKAAPSSARPRLPGYMRACLLGPPASRLSAAAHSPHFWPSPTRRHECMHAVPPGPVGHRPRSTHPTTASPITAQMERSSRMSHG